MTLTPMKSRRIKSRELLDEIKSSPCVVCGAGSDPAHIKSRGAGGDDVADNLLALCRRHHSEQHALGWSGFVGKYPAVEWILDGKGWVVEEQMGRRRLVRK